MLTRTIRKLFSTGKLLYAEKIPSTSSTPESKPNLLIVHGILGNGKLYRHLALHPKTRQNYNSYVLDLPDHGKSFSTAKISVPEIGRDIAKWIKAQDFKKDLTIVAHSLGGRAVVSMTSQFSELQQMVKPIILLDVATHSYNGFPFHKKTEQYLQILKQIDLKTSDEKILEQIRKISVHDSQFQMMKASINFKTKEWRFNLDALANGYDELIDFSIDSADWKSKIYAIKALRSAFMNDFSKSQLKRIYPNVTLIDVDCYHNIQSQRPDVVYDIIHK